MRAIIGGEPVDEKIIMWWNLIARENGDRGLAFQLADRHRRRGRRRPEVFLPLVERTNDDRSRAQAAAGQDHPRQAPVFRQA